MEAGARAGEVVRAPVGRAEALRLPHAGGASFFTLPEAFLGRGRSKREGLELSTRCLVSVEVLEKAFPSVEGCNGCFTACPCAPPALPLLFSDGPLVSGPSSFSHSSTAFARDSCHESE